MKPYPRRIDIHAMIAQQMEQLCHAIIIGGDIELCSKSSARTVVKIIQNNYRRRKRDCKNKETK